MVADPTFPEVVLSLAVFLAAGAMLTPIAERVNVPSSVVLVVLGLLVGAFLRETELLTLGLAQLGGETFNELVEFVFLPTLIFAAARAIPTRLFMRNLVPILALALPATGLSMLLVGFGTDALVGMPLASALVFGALISSTDPVAVVEAFRRLGVSERLATIVSGESLFNDGIAIVAYSIMLTIAGGDSIGLAAGSVEFVVVFFGGLGVGIAVGLLASVVLARLDDLASTSFTVAVAYGAFAAADLLGFSGVVATLVAGLLVGATTTTTSSPRVRRWLEGLWGTLEFGMTAVLFLLMGLILDPQLIADNWSAILWALLVTFVARVVSIVVVVRLTTSLPGIAPLERGGEAVLVWGGLRGAVALALALAIPSSIPGQETIVAMTVGVVLATMLVNATTIGWLIHRLGLNRPTRQDRLVGAMAVALGAGQAREQLSELGLDLSEVDERVDRVAAAVADVEADDLELDKCVTGYALALQRSVYQRRLDTGMLTGPDAPRLIHEVERELDEMWLGEDEPLPGAAVRAVDWLEEQVARVQPQLDDEVAAAYVELHSRRIATEVAAREVRALAEMELEVPEVTGRLDRAAGAVADRLDERARVLHEEIAVLDERHPDRGRELWEAGTTMRTGVLATEAVEELVRRNVVSSRAAELAIAELDAMFEVGQPR